jgi:uncharacterized membrane protein YfcA
MARQFGEAPLRDREQVRAIGWRFVLWSLSGAAAGVIASAYFRSTIPLFAVFVWILAVQMYFRRKYPDSEITRWWQ